MGQQNRKFNFNMEPPDDESSQSDEDDLDRDLKDQGSSPEN